MEPLITLTEITYTYSHSEPALHGINLSIWPGEKIAIVGSNGAGKSTLLLVLNGVLQPATGTILFQGSPLTYDKSSLRTLHQKIGFVFQDPDTQIIAPTVWQDVAFGPVNLDLPEEEVDKTVRDALIYVGLEGFDRRPPYHLSGGEKKRVAIAGVLAMDPDILILDEPTSMLDPAGSEDIMDLLDELNNQGKTLIISTHDVELAYPWADRIILMHQGRIIADGPPKEALSDRDLARQAHLKIPVLLDLYLAMKARGMPASSPLPRSVLDMIRVIEQEHHGMMRPPTNGCGTIYLADVDLVSGAQVHTLLECTDIHCIGVMGSRAKISARQWKITPHFTYAVIDKSILNAMNGKKTLILTTRGMVQRVISRVDEFNQENGRNIQIDLVSTPGDAEKISSDCF